MWNVFESCTDFMEIFLQSCLWNSLFHVIYGSSFEASDRDVFSDGMSSPPAHAWCVEMFYLMMQSVSSSGHKNYSGRMLETHLKLHSAPVHLSHTFLLTISNNLELSNAWDKKQTWIFFYLLIYSNGLSPVWMKHSKLLKNK